MASKDRIQNLYAKGTELHSQKDQYNVMGSDNIYIKPSMEQGGNVDYTIEQYESETGVIVEDQMALHDRERFPTQFIMDLNSVPCDKEIVLMGKKWDNNNADPTFFLDLDWSAYRRRDKAVTPFGTETLSNAGGIFVQHTVIDNAIKIVADYINAGSTSLADSAMASIIGAESNNSAIRENYNRHYIAIGLKAPSGGVMGNPVTFVEKMISYLKTNKYEFGTQFKAGASGPNWNLMYHKDGTTLTTHLMAMALSYTTSTTTLVDEYEKTLRVAGFLFSQDDATIGECIIILDLTNSNIDEALTTSDKVFLSEFGVDSSPWTEASSTVFNDALLCGIYDTVPEAVQEGSDIKSPAAALPHETGVVSYNYCQIFRSDSLKITGTQLAVSPSKRRNDTVERDRNIRMSQFKVKKQNAMLYSQKKKTTASDGMEKRSVGGIFSYEQFQIRYIFANLVLANNAEGVKDMLEDIAERYVAYKPSLQGRTIELACSTTMWRLIDKAIKDGNINESALYGYSQQKNVSGNETEIDFGMRYKQFNTSWCNFKIRPEYMLEVRPKISLPGFVQKDWLTPRYIMYAYDPSILRTRTLRPTRLKGNQQANGADYYLEDFLAEESVEITDPKKFMMILVKRS